MNESNNQVKSIGGDIGPEIKLNFNVPIMHQKKFAESVGLSVGVIGGWVDNGYIPTLRIGKYRMINLLQLTTKMMDFQK